MESSHGEALLTTFAAVRDRVRRFVAARAWDKFHTPRDVCLALAGEVGELAELFQWKPPPLACGAGSAGLGLDPELYSPAARVFRICWR